MGNYIIIGGSTGIGLSVRNLLENEGHSVLCYSRSLGGYDTTSDDPGFPVPEKDFEAAGLVYCPGSIRLKPLRSLKLEDFREDFELNLLGAVKSIVHFLPALQKGEGSVVLFSTVAVRTGMPYHASVAAAKGAVEGLVRSLAAEFAPKVRVNAIAPSLTDTPLATNLLNSDQKKKSSVERHPLARLGKPDDIAEAVLMVLKNRFITGQIIQADGGISSVRK